MYKAELDIKFITPAFIRGANQRSAELRTASIKGAMRWWFRALAGNYFGDDIEGLKRAESYVFGSTGQRSRVSISLSVVEPEDFRFDRKFRGLSYIWFPIARSTPKIGKYYPPNTELGVTIQSYDKRAFNVALISFWTLVSLGGIGFRSRHGAGSMEFTNDEGTGVFSDIGLPPEFHDIGTFRKSIENAINAMGQLLNRTRIQFQSFPTYPVLNNRTSFVGLWDPRTGYWAKALSNFQREYMKFRKDTPKTHRIVFGLPLLPDWRERRASPMHVGAIHIGRRLYLRVVKFRTEPYHPSKRINERADWKVLSSFDEKLHEAAVFGSLGVFTHD